MCTRVCFGTFKLGHMLTHYKVISMHVALLCIRLDLAVCGPQLVTADDKHHSINSAHGPRAHVINIMPQFSWQLTCGATPPRLHVLDL